MGICSKARAVYQSLGKLGLATFLSRPLGLTFQETSQSLILIEKFNLFCFETEFLMERWLAEHSLGRAAWLRTWGSPPASAF